MYRLLLLGLNHTTAPLEVRERLAFNAAQAREAVAAFPRRFPGTEAVLLSTCNRVELYAARSTLDHPEPRPTVTEMIEFLSVSRGYPLDHHRPHFYHRADRKVAEHLFAVTSSLDSMVLGETQILGQVRDAYDLAREAGSVGSLLNPLFQRALNVGKRVMHETALNEGRLSVASVAVDYARRIFEHFNDKTVLCIGAGKMATLALQSFVDLKPKRLLVCNRDPTKAAALAQRFGGEAVAFERLGEHLVAADIVVSSTGSALPIITRKTFEPLLKARRYRPIFLIDIALPRDVDPAVGELDHVYLYNLDDLQQVVAQTQSQRAGAIEAARRIVTAGVDEYVAWHRAREVGPTIDALYKRYHAVAQDELARTLNKLPHLSEADKAQLEEMTRRTVNKLLHKPVQALRRAEGAHTPAGQYLHALEKLFQLGENGEVGGGSTSPDAAAEGLPANRHE
jgi:glutamyl-tRNA reductase